MVILNALRFNPEAPIFKIFFEGMPPDPLALVCYACSCASHNST